MTIKTSDVPAELRAMMAALTAGRRAPQGRAARTELRFLPAEDGICEVAWQGREATVRYGTPAQAARALGAWLAGLVPEGGAYREATPFRTLGVMLDCSRNAVMTVEHITEVWLPRLCLLGYNMVMLYTEDTYELPDEPWFGYRRGAYSAAELKRIVAAAERLHLEVVPCIQTLGHLERILCHPAYGTVRDTGSVMMVGEPETYALIEKMVVHWADIVPTKRIHVGMDETHDLGRGRYLDRHGYRKGFDLFNEHLAKVVEICRRHGLEPMIWSDMYFRLGSETNDYYDPGTKIPPRVAKRIPQEAQLVYWDYYHDEPAFYLDWIERHRALGKDPFVASGIWTWNMHWYDRRWTETKAGACIRACRQAETGELLFTMWGDNGAYCDHDSAFAGMAWCADVAYGTDNPSAKSLEKRFGAICGGSYAAHRKASDLYGCVEDFRPNLWDDPFGEVHFRTWARDDLRRMAATAKQYGRLAAALAPHARDRACGDLGYAWRVAQLCAERYALCTDLLRAYRSQDRKRLAAVQKRIPEVRRTNRALAKTFRALWLRHNKPAGLECIQGRFAFIDARLEELSTRLGEYLKGRCETIDELDGRCPPA